MAGWKRYTGKPLQVNVTESVSKRIAAVADRDGVSKASVIRDIIDAGLAQREKETPRD